MRIAVTGGTGFIGQNLIRRLCAEGHLVCALARPGRAQALPQLPADCPGSLEACEGDLTDPASLDGFLEGAAALIHLAGRHDHHSEEEMQAVNVTGTEHLMAEAKAHAPDDMRFVLVSSAVIGQPVYGYYRDSKRVQEKIVRSSGYDWASFRPTLVYGVGDTRHTGPFLRRCAKQQGTYWVPHEGVSKINPVHVDDVVDAILLYLTQEQVMDVDSIYELAGPTGIPFNEFLDLTMAAAGGRQKRRNVPRRWVERFLLLKGVFTDVTRQRRGASYFFLHHDHDISAAIETLGWQPRTYATGIAQVASGDWWRSSQE
ncbi:MAG: NAD(P)-dependent oxidoreductase [Planctomycetota bacterium]|nr:NAD(P)-dependent oxidoreductase [Planctomycetota bacterium]MDP6838508.1 NAD(P)-dependent oxidoreductase [Planctomycetota bacterium]